jgi:hypothetical protein
MWPNKIPINTKQLPADVFNYRENQWYDLVHDISGEDDIMELLKFFHLRSPLVFLACRNPIEFLNHDADALLPIKEKLCVKLASSSYVVLPGVQAALGHLILTHPHTHPRLLKEGPEMHACRAR